MLSGAVLLAVLLAGGSSRATPASARLSSLQCRRTGRSERHVYGLDNRQVRCRLDVAVFRVATADVRHHNTQLLARLPVHLQRYFSSVYTSTVAWHSGLALW